MPLLIIKVLLGMETCRECFVGNGHILLLCFSVQTKHGSHFSIFSCAKLCDAWIGLGDWQPTKLCCRKNDTTTGAKKNISIKKGETKKIRSRYIQ